MSNNNSLMVLDNHLQGDSKSVKEALNNITNKHIEISKLITPKQYIYKKQSFDYVKIEYMRAIANKYFPTHSWKIIHSGVIGSEAYEVHGRLIWHEETNGVMIERTGDMVAGHRIQKQKETNSFVDVGNDIKSANTDCMKKAYNMHMNIADDVYRNQYQEIELADEQKEKLIVLATKAGNLDIIKEQIDNNQIHGKNYKAAVEKLKRQSETKEKENTNV